MLNTATAARTRGTFPMVVGSIWLLACSSSALQKPNPDAAAGTGGGLSGSGGTSAHGGAVAGGTSGGYGGSTTGSGGSSTTGTGGTFARTGGAAGATITAPATGGKAGSTDAGAGGAGGLRPDAGLDAAAPTDAGIDAGTLIDGGWGEVGSALADFCVGSQSKVLHLGQTYEAPATSKWTDPFLSCCQVFAARVHTSEALGKDFEVVVRFQASMEEGGVIPVGSAGGRLTASLRTNPVSSDAGLADDAMLAGSIYVGGRPFGNDVWTLGACVSVDDPASPFSGTRVYVPGVPVAPHGWSSRLRFLPLKDPGIPISSVETKDLSSLELATNPLLDLMDIDFVDADSTSCSRNDQSACNWVGLNTALFSGTTLASKVTNTAPGTPFVVEADGQRIYLGVFQSIISAYAPRVARVGFEDIRADGFPIYAPRAATPEPDLRNDPRIVKVLTEAGKLIP